MITQSIKFFFTLHLTAKKVGKSGWKIYILNLCLVGGSGWFGSTKSQFIFSPIASKYKLLHFLVILVRQVRMAGLCEVGNFFAFLFSNKNLAADFTFSCHHLVWQKQVFFNLSKCSNMTLKSVTELLSNQRRENIINV